MIKYYKISEVAEILSVTRGTVYNWISKGEIQSVYICGRHRISEEEIKKRVVVNKSAIDPMQKIADPSVKNKEEELWNC